jgi:hypothetical protein
MTFDVEKERERGMRQLQEFYGLVPLPTFTCDNCPYLEDKSTCPYLYDIYNTHGDCLAVK